MHDQDTYLQPGELCENELEPLGKVSLSKLDLPHVERPDSSDLVLLVDHGGGLPLGLAEDDVHKVLGGGHHRDLLEVVLHHGGGLEVPDRSSSPSPAAQVLEATEAVKMENDDHVVVVHVAVVVAQDADDSLARVVSSALEMESADRGGTGPNSRVGERGCEKGTIYERDTVFQNTTLRKSANCKVQFASAKKTPNRSRPL